MKPAGLGVYRDLRLGSWDGGLSALADDRCSWLGRPLNERDRSPKGDHVGPYRRGGDL